MRYKMTKETWKEGRKQYTNWVVFDTMTNSAVYRSSDETLVQSLVDKMNMGATEL